MKITEQTAKIKKLSHLKDDILPLPSIRLFFGDQEIIDIPEASVEAITDYNPDMDLILNGETTINLTLKAVNPFDFWK